MNVEIENNIRKNVSWIHLSGHIKQILNNSANDYEKYIVSFSIKNQLRYRGNLVRYILKDEKRYYERIIAYSKERLMLFPYHLADMIVKGLRITPFNYYTSVVEKLMQDEKSYDTLPNFTAADVLRLLGIGRNEYIDLMNQSRSNRARLFGKRNVKGLLPKVPCDVHIEPWWRVEVGLVLDDDIKLVNEEEREVIDTLIDFGSRSAGELNYHTVVSLYKKGLIYLDVPVTAADYIQVPPLQGFVMNRVLGDYFETLLYKIFVSIDEHTAVGELAAMLEVDTESVKQAVSLYCRLQFARKLDPDTEKDKAKRHISWFTQTSQELRRSIEITPLTLNLSNENALNLSKDSQIPQTETPESPLTATLTKKGHRVAFLFDSTLTAFLMMGNLTPGLKKHAVTMFEVGKLSDESLDSFLAELEKVSVLDAEGEGEARRYFDHAVILRSTIMSLRKLPSSGLDLIRLESLHSLDDATCSRLLQKKYSLLVSMAPLSREVRPVLSLNPPHLGPAVPEVNSLWFKLFIYHLTGYGPASLLLIRGTQLKQLPRMFLGYSRLLITTWLHEPAVIPTANILHINTACQYSAVLIQAYGVHDVAQTYILPFPFRPDTPSKINQQFPNDYQKFGSHPAIKCLDEHLDLRHSCGYIAFINNGVLDFGCANKETTVKLGRNQRHIINTSSASRQNSNVISAKIQEPLSLANENFSFSEPSNKSSKNNPVKLQSPDETHFALTPTNDKSSSPSNGFTSHESTQLLQKELDELALRDDIDTGSFVVTSSSLNNLLSPMDENISMFTIIQQEEVRVDEGKSKKDENNGEIWTLLDCHFGIPLFEVNANTKICDTVVSGGLAQPLSLDCLVESGRRLGSNLLDFISQCQYYVGENMEILKRGRLVPLPRYSIVFDNGKISEWSGK